MKKRLQEPIMIEKWRMAKLGKRLSNKTIEKIKDMKEKKPKSISRLKQILDSVFSIYIRKKYSDENGYVTCFTCGKNDEWKKMQCGHYVSRTHNSLRYSELNCHPQCVSCNIFKQGAMDIYAINLQKKYGIDILEKLQLEKNKLHQFSNYELEGLIKMYIGKNRVNDSYEFIEQNKNNGHRGIYAVEEHEDRKAL
jgi:hypothetical protein